MKPLMKTTTYVLLLATFNPVSAIEPILRLQASDWQENKTNITLACIGLKGNVSHLFCFYKIEQF